MITEQDLQEAIAECEGQRNPTSSTCLKLAAFYTIRDKMYPANDMPAAPKSNGYSYAGPPENKSDFLKLASNVGEEDFLSVMDELMSAIQVIVPKLYNGTMNKLAEKSN